MAGQPQSKDEGEVVIVDSPLPPDLLPVPLSWSLADKCCNCGTQVGMGTRHHCRACFEVVCGACSHCDWELTEEALEGVAPQIPWRTSVTMTLTRLLYPNQGDPQNRVCLRCPNSSKLKARQRPATRWDNYLHLVLPYLTMEEVHNCFQINRCWGTTANKYRIDQRQLFYSIKLGDSQWELMQRLRLGFPGHSRWVLRFLTHARRHGSQDTMQSAVELLTEHIKLCEAQQQPKPTAQPRNCLGMFCHSKNCVQDCTPLQALELLCLDLPLTDAHQNWALEILFRGIDWTHLQCLLPALTDVVVKSANRKQDPEEVDTNIILKLLNYGKKHGELQESQVVSGLCWCLLYHANPAVAVQASVAIPHWSSDNVEIMINKLIAEYPEHTRGYAHFSFFLVLLSKEIQDCGKNDEALKEHVQGIATKATTIFQRWPMFLPHDPQHRIVRLLPTVSVKSSQARPVVLSFVTIDGRSHRVLLKRENLRLDEIALNCIKYADLVLKKELPNWDIPIQTYNVWPITGNCGLIEMVDSAVTLSSVIEEYGSISQYLLDNSADKTQFVLSTAAYTVLTYLLGAGDRHLDNLLLKPNGQLLHIDYGFILGQKPLLETVLCPSQQVRVTSQMMEALGRKNRKPYQLYAEMVSKIYSCLRGHHSVFLRLFLLAHDLDPNMYTVEAIQNQVATRFQIGEIDSVATKALWQALDDSADSLADSGRDHLHKCSRDNTLGKWVPSSTSDHVEPQARVSAMMRAHRKVEKLLHLIEEPEEESSWEIHDPSATGSELDAVD
eukprot:TRINITY_DN27352_c0_g1_i1.p1 TRINITY_DN27352_c0_g1~~TRINITY_DN27352_c0_g1_i1.p1  ORF type:complete len:804 (+),score=29.03 TRINITY_DN27352_c0_g1_i1:72-2414(+)